MLVEDAVDEVGDLVAPEPFLLHLHEVLLDEGEDGADVVLGVFQKTEEELGGAVAGGAAHAEDAAVDVVDALDDALNRIREGELLVVVAVDADLLALEDTHVFLGEVVDLLGVEVAEAVDEVDDVEVGVGELVEGFLEVGLEDVGCGHDVDAYLVAGVFAVLAEVDGLVDLLGVGGDAVHGDDGLILGEDGVVVGAADVAHDGDLGVGGVGDLAQELLVAEAPGAVLLDVELLLVGAIAELDIVHPRAHEAVIDLADQLLAEIPVVHEATIADGAVQGLDLRAVHQMTLLEDKKRGTDSIGYVLGTDIVKRRCFGVARGHAHFLGGAVALRGAAAGCAWELVLWRFICYTVGPHSRRGVRVVEGGGLENR